VKAKIKEKKDMSKIKKKREIKKLKIKKKKKKRSKPGKLNFKMSLKLLTKLKRQTKEMRLSKSAKNARIKIS